MLKTRSGTTIGKGAPPLCQVSDEELLLNRAEAAEYLRTSTSTMERWHRQGTGPRVRFVGRRAFYTLADLRRFAGFECQEEAAE